jgi:hypothetical protein
MGVALILAPNTAKPNTNLHVQSMLSHRIDKGRRFCDMPVTGFKAIDIHV